MTEQTETPRYGGRALRNGVMMVGPHAIAVAVRKPDGTIETAVEPFDMPGMWARNVPFVRGLVSFGGMLKLAKAANRMETRLNGGRKVGNTLPQFAPGLGAMMADRIGRELSRRAGNRMVTPIEAIAGVALPFVAFGVSGKMPGVNDLWRYHGAEHKAVNAAEAGLELTPANAGAMSRVHPRCGTVFAFWGLLGGFLSKRYLSSLPDDRRKAVAGLVAGPLLLSVAYELVRLGAVHKDHPVGKVIFAPAWNSQRLTTAEPGQEELEVAIAALQGVMEYEKAHSGQ